MNDSPDVLAPPVVQAAAYSMRPPGPVGVVLIAVLCAGSYGCSREAPHASREPPSIAAAVPPEVRDACVAVEQALERQLGLTVTNTDSTVTDHLVATPHPACVLSSTTTFNGSGAVDSLAALLEAGGWTWFPGYDADGPDGTLSARRRSGVVCILSGSWDGGDDSDSTYVPAPGSTIRVECRAVLPSDADAGAPTPSAAPRGEQL